jgi:hypothetical protein
MSIVGMIALAILAIYWYWFFTNGAPKSFPISYIVPSIVTAVALYVSSAF